MFAGSKLWRLGPSFAVVGVSPTRYPHLMKWSRNRKQLWRQTTLTVDDTPKRTNSDGEDESLFQNNNKRHIQG